MHLEQRRRLWPFVLAPALLIGRVVAAPSPTSSSHVRVDVSLAGAAPSGSEGLGYFVGEVGRELSEELRKDGVGVSSSGDVVVAVTIDERAGDRVALTARTRGHHVEVEGTVESLDALVDELATRIVPLVPNVPVVAATPAAIDAHKHAPSHVASPTPPAPTKESAPATPPPQAPTPQPVLAQTPPPTVPPPQTTTQETTKSPVVDPYGPDARVADAAAFARNRVVVHTLYDPDGAPQGTGSMATQAIYAVLQRHLHFAIVPLGAGVTNIATAVEESARAQARVVVMARIDGYQMFMTQGGPVARMRLDLSAVSEGRLILRRALYAETPANAVVAATAEGRRGRSVDPVFLAVTHALEGDLADLQLALLGNAPR